MAIRTVSLALVCVVFLAGCATKDYVNEQISSLSKRVDSQQAEVANATAQHQTLENRVNNQQTVINDLSRTAQEALDRASAAGKLNAGKFLYEKTLSSQIGFDFDTSEPSAYMKKALDAFAAQLKADNKNVYIEIQGHTDSIGTPTANLALGQARAESVRHYLAVNGGIPLHRMNVISYGEALPVATNMYKPGRAQNRRVALVVLQ